MVLTKEMEEALRDASLTLELAGDLKVAKILRDILRQWEAKQRSEWWTPYN